MPRLFWPNFDFEHELARGSTWQPPVRLRELNAALAHSFCALAETGDVIVVPELASTDSKSSIQFEYSSGGKIECRLIDDSTIKRHDEFRGSEWELVPWGVTPSLEQLALNRHWAWSQPDFDLVRRLNDRATSHLWENETQTIPDCVEVISSFEDLNAAITNLGQHRWVLKARFGMSARERLLGESSKLTPQQTGWIEKRLREQGELYFEPWLDSVGEVGIQLQIPAQGEIETLAMLPLMNSAHGEYQGSRFFLTDSERLGWEPAVEIAIQIAADFQKQGYFGPLGIDAMQYRDGDEIKLRPVQDINARWTMGRIAWEWKRLLAADDRATWYQGDKAEALLRDPDLANRLIRTVPDSWPPRTIVPSILLK